MISDNNKKGRKIWIKALCIMIVFIFVFTFISRTAASFTVAKVSTDTMSARKIEHTVIAEGTIIKNREIAIITQPDILISEVYVSNGDVVQENDVLMQLDMDNLNEQIQLTEDGIKKINYENDDLRKHMSKEIKDTHSSTKRARKDYKDAVRRNKKLVRLAYTELKAAKKQLAKERKRIDTLNSQQIDKTDVGRAKQDYASVTAKNEAAVTKALTLLQNAKAVLEAEQKKNAADINESLLKEYKENVQKCQDDYDTAVENQEKEVLAAKRALEDAKNNNKTSNEEAIKALEEKLADKQLAYDTACETRESELTTARRAIEDATAGIESDSTIEVNNIEARQLESKLTKMNALVQQQGRITAKVSGTITGVSVGVGQKTTDTAAFTMTKDEDGYTFTAQINKEDVKYVSTGDSVKLSCGSTEIDDVALTYVGDANAPAEDGIKTGETTGVEQNAVTNQTTGVDNSLVTVRAAIPVNSFAIGACVTMTASKNSPESSCTVPLSALSQENNKSYLYVVDTEQTVLGEVKVARKIEVKVVDKNDSYAALEEDSLTEDSQIITDTDRQVEAGARVRLMEQ